MVSFAEFDCSSGVQHAKYSDNALLLNLALESQQFLLDLKYLLEIIPQKKISSSVVVQFKTSLVDILDQCMCSSEASIDKPQVINKIITAASTVSRDLALQLQNRLLFDIHRASKSSRLIVIPLYLARFDLLAWPVLNAYLDSLWLIRHLSCLSTSGLKFKLFFLRLVSAIGSKSIHIDNLLTDSIDHYLPNKPCFSFLRSPSVCYESQPTIYSFTGPDLYAFGHALTAYESLCRHLSDHSLSQYHEIRIAPSLTSNSALALLIYRLASDSKDRTSVKISDRDLVLDSVSHLSVSHSLANQSLLNLIKLHQWNTDHDNYLEPLSIDTGLISWLEARLDTPVYLYSRPYICLYLRDGGFKRESTSFHTNSDRNVIPNAYIPLIERLISHGYDVVRLGDPLQAPIEFSSNHYFEYSHSKLKNDLNDLSLVQNCEFVISAGAGGGANIGDIFGKHTLFIDYPIARRGVFSPLSVVIPKSYSYDNIPISVSDLLNKTPNGCHDAVALKNIGITCEQVSFDLMSRTVDKFISCIQSSNAPNLLDSFCLPTMLDLQGVKFPMKVVEP